MAKKRKLVPLSRLTNKELDSVAVEKRHYEDRRAFDVLLQAQQYWNNLSNFRRERERNKNYTFGKQWSDMVTVDGQTMTEEAYIQSQGSIPLKNNLIRRLVRNVLGVYRSQSKEPTCVARDRDEQRLGETMSTILQYNWQLNRMQEVNSRTFEDFLIGGMIVHRKWWGWNNDKCDCWTDYVNPNNFFVDNAMRDFRGWDCSFIGEIHDLSFEKVCQTFADTPADVARLKEIYHDARNKKYVIANCQQFGQSSLKNIDFMCPYDTTMCRVIEIWRKESKPRYRCHDYLNGDYYKIDIEDYHQMVETINEERVQEGLAAGMEREDIPLIKAEWFMDDYWYFYFLTPFGQILQEGETPFEHKSHPYVFKIYPFIDGEPHSFVSDVIDQQRYVNRLITLYDWIMRASAKGVLLFPEECLPEDKCMEDIAEEWARFNGVIAIKAKPGVEMPKQVSNNATNIGIHELLNIQLQFFEDISGVSGALQGKPGYAGTSGSKYAQEAQNATTSLLDLLDSFSMFIIDSAYKDVKNIQQFYDSKRVFNIAGKTGTQIEYDPKKVRDVEFDLSITESANSPAYRTLANDLLMEIWRAGQISLEQLLKHGDFPFADDLLQSVQSQQEQIQNGQIPGALSPELKAQVQQGANMQAVNMASQAIKPAA
ncbi:hypothetical protein [Bacteroides congonensis]|uniref:portal protein n=1 Tax=Bacteroides congonensis TaxID=1871006 RepID=UPI003A84537F